VKKLIVAVACGALGGYVLSTNAALIGHWDASSPGASPSTQWDDLSGTGHHLTTVDNGNGGPSYNAGSGSYTLGNTAGFIGTGPTSDYDFDTSAGGGSADPYTWNLYVNWGGSNSGDVAYTLMTKAQREGAGNHYRGHTYQLSWSEQDSLQLGQQPGNNSDRHVTRRADGVGGSLASRDAMLTVTHDGSGTGGGTKFYVDGVEITVSRFSQSALNGTTLNAGALQIGSNDDTGGLDSTNNGFVGDLFFVEIYNHELSGSEVLSRFNQIPEPSTLILLGIGGGLLWWRRRR
jgi:hypothetical protein